MIKFLHFAPLFLWSFLATADQTSAERQTNSKHLGPPANEHAALSIRELGTHEKRKRSGRKYILKRCKVPTHAHGSGTPTSSAVSNAGSSVPREPKKWGLAWPNGDASYLANFARPKVRYLYTWSPYLPSATADLAIEGIPMLWGRDQVDDFTSMVTQGYATKVLGMNEPEEPSQSNMSPDEGISLWRQYIDPLKDQGYYLISPACTNDQAGLDWMQAFVEGCTDCRIDAVAFHFYGTDSEALVQHATTLHDSYGKPVWITEFADQNFSGSGDQASMPEIYAFQSAVIDFVENTPWIEAAFPFGVMYDMQGVNEGNSLLTADGWPTSLAYNYFG